MGVGARLSALTAVVVLTAGGAACGGGSGKATVNAAATAPETTTTTGDPGAAYTACLRDHGVDLPERQRPADGTPGSRPSTSAGPGGAAASSRPPGSRPSTSLPPGVDQAKLDAARQACQSLQPTDRGPNGPQSQAFQAYASCLKDHGVTFNPGNGGGPGPAQRDDPAFQAAEAICGVLRPAGSTTTSTR